MTATITSIGPLYRTGRIGPEGLAEELRKLERDLEPIDIAGYHYRHRQNILPKYPPRVRVALMREYLRISGPTRSWPDGHKAGSHCSWAKANRRLWHRDTQLESAKLRFAFSEDRIRDKARRCAKKCSRLTQTSRSMPEAYAACSQYAGDERVLPPTPKTNSISMRSAHSRMLCQFWWRRQLRNTFARLAEGRLRELGFVSRRAGVYASDETVKRRLEQKKRKRQMLEGLVAVNDLGESFSLAEISDSSNSNPKIRRCEMMARLAGIEEYARANNWAADFYTLTTPSRFHAFFTSGEPNPNFQDLTPRESQEWLSKNWARIRSKLARDGIDAFGVRIAEPHHDGTTHWHLLLFSRSKNRSNIEKIVRRYMLHDSPEEPGARKHRVKVTPINYKGGSATAYVAKYVSKNIDGAGVGPDHEDSDSVSCVDNAVRVEAWASTWAIRQFQFFGTPPMGPWRELRRIRKALKSNLERFRRSVDAGKWSDYITEMGGVCQRIVEYPVQLWKKLRDQPGHYGDPPRRETVGVSFEGAEIRTRERVWAIVPSALLEFCQ